MIEITENGDINFIEHEKEYIIENGLGKRIHIDYIKHTYSEWEMKEIPPTNDNKIRTVIFTRNEEWRFEDE